MADIKTTGPGDAGSTNGDIKTPMCSENVDNQGKGKVHNYDKATGGANSGTPGGSDIKGPGAQGLWDAGIKIKGSNLKY